MVISIEFGGTSTIAGQLQANGQVYLVNPNGIMTGIELKYTIIAHLELTGWSLRILPWRFQP